MKDHPNFRSSISGSGRKWPLLFSFFLVFAVVLVWISLRPTASRTATDPAAPHAVDGVVPEVRRDISKAATAKGAPVTALPACIGTFALSEPVPSGAELASIASTSSDGIVLSRRSGKCQLHLEALTLVMAGVQPAKEERAEHGSTTSPLTGSSGGISTSDFADIIKSNGEHRFDLRVAELRAIFERGGTAVTDLKLLNTDDGVVVEGEPGLYGFLGIARGDTLLSVNQEPVQDTADLMASFMELQAGRGMQIKVRREGQVQELRYTAE